MNTKQKGDIAEAHVLAALLKFGYDVLIPFGDRARYDLAIEIGGKIIRIQVKTARCKNNGVEFATSSSTTRNGVLRYENYVCQIDYFAVYAPWSSTIYVIHVSECGKRATCLTLDEKSAHTNQFKRRRASDYEFKGPLAHHK